MSKYETTKLKGIAILMMLFLHLFNNPSLDHLCTHYIYVDGYSLVNFLSRACNPVHFFLILGGYGLYCVWLGEKDNNRYKRIGKLFTHYWITLLIFVPITIIFINRTFIDGILDFIVNVTALDCSWNNAVWFLLPYAILSLSYPILFKSMQHKGALLLWISLFGYLAAAYIMSKYPQIAYHQHIISLFNNVLYLSFSFLLGAWLRKFNLVTYISKINIPSWSACLCLLILVIIRCIINSISVDPIYSLLFILFFIKIKIPLLISKALHWFGIHSLNIWLIHIWISMIILKDFIYHLQYPIVIFAATLAISSILSIAINYLCKFTTLT